MLMRKKSLLEKAELAAFLWSNQESDTTLYDQLRFYMRNEVEEIVFDDLNPISPTFDDIRSNCLFVRNTYVDVRNDICEEIVEDIETLIVCDYEWLEDKYYDGECPDHDDLRDLVMSLYNTYLAAEAA